MAGNVGKKSTPSRDWWLGWFFAVVWEMIDRGVKITESAEDDWPAAELFAVPDGGHDELVLRVWPQTGQRDCVAVTCDHRHYPVTKSLPLWFNIMIDTLTRRDMHTSMHSRGRKIAFSTLFCAGYWWVSIARRIYGNNFPGVFILIDAVFVGGFLMLLGGLLWDYESVPVLFRLMVIWIETRRILAIFEQIYAQASGRYNCLCC